MRSLRLHFRTKFFHIGRVMGSLQFQAGFETFICKLTSQPTFDTLALSRGRFNQ
jgi:hypothetical protein